MTDHEEEVEFTSTYTKIQTQAEKKAVRVFKQNKGDYENGHSGGTLLKSEAFYVGQQIKVTWTRQSDNAPFYYGFGGERVSREPVRESASGSVVVESTRTFIVPQNGIDIFLLPPHEADPSKDKVSIVAVEPARTNNVLNSNALTGQGTGRTYAFSEAVGRLAGLLSGGSGDGSGSRGNSDSNTSRAVNGAPDPETDKNQGLYYEDDDWSMEVTLKRGAGDNQFLILDSDGHTIGTFSQETTSEGSYWNADLTGINMTSDDRDLYYYYISEVSEENVPDGMTPSIDTDTVAGKTVKRLYSKNDADNNTGRKLSVTNSIIIADKEITIFKVIEGTTTPLTGAKFKLTKVDQNGNAVSGKDAYSTDEIEVDSSGRINFTGLAPGRYKLEEKKIPAGYIVIEGPYYITVSSDGSTELDTSVPHEMIKPVTNSDKEYIVENKAGATLPNTGGIGTRPFTILGSALILAAGVLLWRRRRLI